MYLICPETTTTMLSSGSLSTRAFRLRSYSSAGIPGVVSFGFTAHDASVQLRVRQRDRLTEMWVRGKQWLAESRRFETMLEAVFRCKISRMYARG